MIDAGATYYVRVGGYASGGGISNYGVHGSVDDLTEGNWAGYFIGNVRASGTVVTPTAMIEIDHPLDPDHHQSEFKEQDHHH